MTFPPYLLDPNMRRSSYDPDYTYVVQNLVDVRDIREVGQRGDLFDR